MGRAWTENIRVASRIAATAGRWLCRFRRPLTALAARGAWWWSLALLLRHASALADFGGPLLPSVRQSGFLTGLAMGLVVVFVGESRSLRSMGAILVVFHAMLAWWVALETGSPLAAL